MGADYHAVKFTAGKEITVIGKGFTLGIFFFKLPKSFSVYIRKVSEIYIFELYEGGNMS